MQMREKQNRERNTASFLVLIFFMSGAAGLGYQVVWAKAFAAAVGHEFPTMLAVVTAFMSGMAIGCALLTRSRSIGTRWYGYLEILIGVWGFATIAFIPLLERFVSALLGLSPSPAFQWFVVFTAVLLILLPATAAMGGTLPAAERFLFGIVQRHTTALLYGINTAGAALGAVAAAFWLMPVLGIRGCAFSFAAVNLFCGCAALLLAREKKEFVSEHTGPTPAPGSLAAQLFCCGLLGIGFEVVIIRALAHVLENTVFTFAVVIAVYLLGTAVGAILFHRRQGTSLLARPQASFALLSFTCAAAAITLRWAPELYAWLRVSFGDSLAAVAVAEMITAAAYFFLPAVLMGAIWSWLAQASLKYKRSLGWAVAINTTGAAVAPVLFALLAIPSIGLKGSLVLFPIGYALLGGRNKIAAAAVLLATAAIPVTTSVRDLIETNGDRIISLQEGVIGSVAVLENAHGARVLKFNNRFQMGGTAARIAEERQADIPLLLHRNPKRALFIGLGTGITFAAAADYPNLHADGVELVPEIAAAMPLFGNQTSESGAVLRTFVADGRRFVRASQEQYDVIVSDLFHPAQDGAGFLYTVEHFAAIRERLAIGGLFCQWIPVYQTDLSTIHTLMATFGKVFPAGEVWLLRFNIDVPVVGLIGRIGGLHYDPESVESKNRGSAVLAAHLAKVGLGDSIRLFGCYLGEIHVAEDAQINTDLDPIVIFRAPALTFRRRDDPGQRLLELISALEASAATLFGTAESEFVARLNNFIAGRDVYLGGLQKQNTGDLNAAISAYIESARISEDFTAGYAQALALATGLAKERPQESRMILEKLVEAQPQRPVAHDLLQRLRE